MARILLVDDSKFVITALRTFLGAEGHEVVATGGDGDEGVELYREHRPDLTMLDVTMPNKSGRECLEDILQFDELASVLMCSAVKQRSVIMECLKIGAKGYVEKPLKLQDEMFRAELRGHIEKALEK